MPVIEAMRHRRAEAHRLSEACAAVLNNGLQQALLDAFSGALTDAPDPCTCALLGALCDHEPPADDLDRGVVQVRAIYETAATPPRSGKDVQ